MGKSEKWHTKQYNRWIQSNRWKRLRDYYISLHPWCSMCEKNGVFTEATCVHHIKPVESVASGFEREQLMFSISNLQQLCQECHAQIHRELRSNNKSERIKKMELRINADLEAWYGPMEHQTDEQKKDCATMFDDTMKYINDYRRSRRKKK